MVLQHINEQASQGNWHFHKHGEKHFLKLLPSNLVQIATHKEIHALTKSILQLYETLPLILNNNNNNNSNRLCNLIYEDTTSLYPECSVQNRGV